MPNKTSPSAVAASEKLPTPVARRVGFAFAALGLLLAISGAIAIRGFLSLGGDIDSLANDSVPGLYLSARVDSAGKNQRIQFLSYLAAADPSQAKIFEEHITAAEKTFGESMLAYEKTIFTPEDRQNFERLKLAHANVLSGWTRIASLATAGNHAEALALWNSEGSAQALAQARAVAAVQDFNKNSADTMIARSTNDSRSTNYWFIGTLIFSLLAAGAISYFIIRSIRAALADLVRQVSAGAEHVAAAAHQISQASQTLAQSASEQAASLEETSASAAEIDSMAARNSTSARNAVEIVGNTENRLRQAETAITGMVSSINAISTASDQVGRIIKDIDGIAFQTNILALNAAVEAARAGEAGLGFAVVAEEVRALAQRCAQAARSTSELVDNSAQRSREGQSKVEDVKGTVDSIATESSRVKQLVDEVSASSHEQSRGITEISKALSLLETVTQRVAANSEEGAATAEELNSQSNTLRNVVTRLGALAGIAA